ncbi:GNAT family N-acetyltransferase [Aquabacterium sp.]|uniref:GNAT family N-acetyltransferase n=1 Tax=Aquabacterium sp. TaxID=1872578 RepID=UPI0025C10DA7|nr:GNAT family N-acetyltransferase [Aquabacterium sp.]
MDRFDSVGAQGEAGAQASMVPGLTVHWHEDLAQIPAGAWDELVSPLDGGTPFLRMALLKAMVDSGSACGETGWAPLFLTLQDEQGRIVGACPLFLKRHSYGEYVFDWAWADAHDRALARHGQHYYPKLLSAVPFSPIPGQRLLTHPALSATQQQAVRQHLLHALAERCKAQGLSSAHVLFLSEAEASLARKQGWLVRQGVQFHWQNRKPEPFADFDDFLASLQRDKRKKIQQERRKVRDAGVSFEVLQGPQIQQADWDFFARCYAQTYHERGQQPYLSDRFWQQVAGALPDCWVLFVASQNGQRIAAALLAIDPVQKVAYGRYWGALAEVSCLHFEACYYQPLAWCITNGMRRFEGGAQGEHKLTRGLLPVHTWSVHWLEHEGLRHAVADFLMRETLGIDQYKTELGERSPFKPEDQRP